jgi:hypothetical protein
VNYRGSALSVGQAGAVHGGDRLPWAAVSGQPGEMGNFGPLTSLDWQVHVYGEAAPDVQRTCDTRGIQLHAFPWSPEIARNGLQRDALYLVRPDGYLALVEARDPAHVLANYLDTHSIHPRTAQEGGSRC